MDGCRLVGLLCVLHLAACELFEPDWDPDRNEVIIEPPEPPGPGPPPADTRKIVADVGEDYAHQVFFDYPFSSGDDHKARVSKASWDLAFSTTDDHILLNSSRLMFAARTTHKDFAQVTSEKGLDFVWDDPTGHGDKTAIGRWRDEAGDSEAFVYVIDLGNDAKGESLGFRKVIFEGLAGDVFHLRHAMLDGSDEKSVRVARDSAYSHVYLSFSAGVVTVAPPKGGWWLCFTQYTHPLGADAAPHPVEEGTVLPYLVTGILINVHHEQPLEVAKSSVSLPDVTKYVFDDPAHVFSKHANAIGYDWKSYDFATNSYEIARGTSYLIRQKGADVTRYLVLRVDDFYSSVGRKGVITCTIRDVSSAAPE